MEKITTAIEFDPTRITADDIVAALNETLRNIGLEREFNVVTDTGGYDALDWDHRDENGNWLYA